MPELTEAERQYLTETQSLTLDEAGREVLVGLTDLESDLLMAYRRRLAAGNTDQDPENLSIWLDLAERHERARPLQTPARCCGRWRTSLSNRQTTGRRRSLGVTCADQSG